jgi:hypothetical protein
MRIKELIYESDELEEMLSDRFAVVDQDNYPHFITDDPKAAKRVAATKGMTVRPIFAPKPKNMARAIRLKKIA